MLSLQFYRLFQCWEMIAVLIEIKDAFTVSWSQISLSYAGLACVTKNMGIVMVVKDCKSCLGLSLASLFSHMSFPVEKPAAPKKPTWWLRILVNGQEEWGQLTTL